MPRLNEDPMRERKDRECQAVPSPREQERSWLVANANYWNNQATRWRHRFDAAEDRVCALERQVKDLRRSLGAVWRKYNEARRGRDE